jgi:hypothetical protein
MHSFLEHITNLNEAKKTSSGVIVRNSKKISTSSKIKRKEIKKHNEGQKYEQKIVNALKKRKMGGEGSSSSGRGSDASINIGKKPYKLEIKGEGSAFGQIRFSHHPDVGWHYHTEKEEKIHPKRFNTPTKLQRATVREENKRRAKKIAKALHGAQSHAEMNAHFGNPKVRNTKAHIKHIESVVGKRGELRSEIAGSPEKLASFLHKTMNENDLVHIQGKGTYSLTTHAEKRTGIPHISKHMDHEASKSGELLSVRHRVKRRSSGTTLTAQINFNKQFLSPSTIDLEKHGFNWKPTTG